LKFSKIEEDTVVHQIYRVYKRVVFVWVHFTTQHVPAVALGIIEQGLSLAEIFSYPHAFGIKWNQCPAAQTHLNFSKTNSNSRRKKDESLQLIYRVSA
jgi:hypothetical protein